MTIVGTQIISPLDIATHGLLSTIESRGNSCPPLTIATMGWIVFIEEEIVDDDEPVRSGGKPQRPKKVEKKRRKKITVTVFFNGEEYTETAYTEDLTMDVSKVKLDIDESAPKPKFTIILPNKDN